MFKLTTKIFEDLKQKLKTMKGIFDIFAGIALKGFLIVTYTELAFNALKSLFGFLQFKPLIFYASFLVFGFFLIPLNLGISFITTKSFKLLNKFKKQIFGGK